MASLYDLGEGVYLDAAFTDPKTGAPLDPTTVHLWVLPPSAPTATPTDTAFTNPAVGTYEALVTADEVGLWQYRWVGENAGPAIQEGSFIVRRTDLA